MLTTPPDLMLFDPVDKSSPRVQATPVHACAETATLDGLLSASECGRLIGFLESTGCFGPGDATLFGGETRVRSNDMLVWLAPRTVTDQLWDRVGLTAWPSGCGQAPVGLNSFVRCYRYRRGQAFLPHYDRQRPSAEIGEDGRSFKWNHKLESRHSLLVYLNSSLDGAFAGGCTTLMPSSRQGPQIEIAPPAGTALVFPHGRHRSSLLHAGERVTSGVKYVLRLDVLSPA